MYQWLSRHFNNKNFNFDENQLLENKSKAIERLNELLSEKIGKSCSSCGCKMPVNARFNICDDCFSARKFSRRPRREGQSEDRGERRDDRRPGGFKKTSGGGGPKRPGQSGRSHGKGPSKSGSNKNAAAAFKKHR